MATMDPSRQSCLAKLLDIRGVIIACRRGMMGADNSTALAQIVIFTLILLCLLPIWIAFDLNSTWEFTTTIRQGAAPILDHATPQAQSMLGMTLGSLLVGVILTSFTLLPTLFELAFPALDHPLVNMVLHASILFDYISDWPRSWATTEGWASNTPVHFIYTVFFNLFMSVGVQALIVISLTVIVFGVITIIRGPVKPMKQQVVIEQ